MKELLNSHQEKKGLWRKATAIAGGLVLLTACDQKPQITDGTVYQKDHIQEDTALVGRVWASHKEIEREVDAMPPTYLEEDFPFNKETIFQFYTSRSERWKVYIAQCPTSALPPSDKIEKECKTASFDVPQE